jgi:hypothetical protein
MPPSCTVITFKGATSAATANEWIENDAKVARASRDLRIVIFLT